MSTHDQVPKGHEPPRNETRARGLRFSYLFCLSNCHPSYVACKSVLHQGCGIPIGAISRSKVHEVSVLPL